MVSPVTGLGRTAQPAIEFAKRIALNVERELNFYGKTLKVYQFNPTAGEAEILSLTEDWAARKQKKNFTQPNIDPWEIEIAAISIPDRKVRKGCIIKIGGALSFKIYDVIGPDANVGAWMFYAELMRESN